MARTVTIIHPGALGDVLLSLPAIRALRASFPRRAVGLLAGSEAGALLCACGEIERLFPLERDALASLLADHVLSGSRSQALREWLGRCDLAVCWMADPDGRLARRLNDLGVDRIIVGSPLSADWQATHQADRFLETLRGAANGMGPARRLSLPDEVLDAAEARLGSVCALGKQPLAVVHPGSGSVHKCSEPALLAQTVAWFQANGAVPMLVGGPADRERLDEVAGLCIEQPPVFQDLDLLSVAGVLAHASLFLGHDSGLTHLAASLQIQTVALFGPTDCSRWAPRGPHVRVLSGVPCLCRERGWQAVRQCQGKPCLQVPGERLTVACQEGLRRSGKQCREQRMIGSAPCHAR